MGIRRPDPDAEGGAMNIDGIGILVGALFAFLALILGFSMGRESVQTEIYEYGCEAVVKTWKQKP